MIENKYSRKIKSFFIKGEAVDQETILRLRKELEDRLEDDMRLRGYVPVLDITPELYWDYQRDENKFIYAITCYGTYVGKNKAKHILGYLGPHPIYREPYDGDKSEKV